jgi:hypothetical protein
MEEMSDTTEREGEEELGGGEDEEVPEGEGLAEGTWDVAVETGVVGVTEFQISAAAGGWAAGFHGDNSE